jgi:hypothetical protein
MPASALKVQENRSAARLRTPGWANIEFANSIVKSDRLYDISQAGISLFLDIQLPSRQEYLLKLSVYHNGKVHLLDVRARCVHSSLVGVSGFRHGFNFSSMGENAQDALRGILA